MRSVREHSRWIWSALLVVAVLASAATGWGAARPEEEESIDAPGFLAAKGRVTFRTYCASCHGQGAKGDGNLAQYLNLPPSNLTEIAERRGGEFPRDEIIEIIDGRESAKGHGTRDMPVWGDVFKSPLAEPGSGAAEEPEERVERKLTELVLFLESIQTGESPVD